MLLIGRHSSHKILNFKGSANLMEVSNWFFSRRNILRYFLTTFEFPTYFLLEKFSLNAFVGVESTSHLLLYTTPKGWFTSQDIQFWFLIAIFLPVNENSKDVSACGYRQSCCSQKVLPQLKSLCYFQLLAYLKICWIASMFCFRSSSRGIRQSTWKIKLVLLALLVESVFNKLNGPFSSSQ